MGDEKAEQNNEVFHFGGFRLDAARKLLSRDGEPVKLTAKAVELLLFLVKNNRRVVSKGEILDAVWPGSFVEEANLTVHISALRKLLAGANDSAGDGDIKIETFPKVGYRFSADIDVLDAGAAALPMPADAAVRGSVRSRWPRFVAYFAIPLVLLTPIYLGFRWLRPTVSAIPAISRLNGFEQVVGYAISPDGQYAAQAASNNGRSTLTMVHLGSNSRIQLVPPDAAGISSLKFSRDGNFIYFTRSQASGKRSLYRTPVFSAEPVKLVDDVGIAIGISPANDRVCFVRQISPGKTAMMIAELDATRERTLNTREGAEAYWSWSVDWSPKGDLIAAAVTGSGPDASTRLVTLNVETGAESPVSGPFWGPGGGEGLAWLADGSGLIFTAGDKEPGSRSQLWHVSLAGGDIQKITNDAEAYAVPFTTLDDQIMSAQFEDKSSLWVAAAPFDSAAPLSSPYKHSFNWVRSNSKGNILFGSNARGGRDIWLINSDGSGERQMTQHAGINIMPVPSDDGRFVVFASDRMTKDKFNIWRMDMDGGNAKQLTSGDGEVQPTISPDGSWVYYSTGNPGEGNNDRTLWRVNSDGGTPGKLTEGPSHGADVSPDGKLFAAWYKPAGLGWKLAVFNADGGTPLKLFDAEPGVPVKWTADGTAIAYLKVVNGVSNIWKQPLSGGDAVQVTHFTSMRIANFDWTSDGRIVCSRTERATNVVIVRNFR